MIMCEDKKDTGVCRECGCTEDNARVRPLGLESCGWANPDHTLCTFCKEKRPQRGDR